MKDTAYYFSSHNKFILVRDGCQFMESQWTPGVDAGGQIFILDNIIIHCLSLGPPRLLTSLLRPAEPKLFWIMYRLIETLH